MFLSFKKHTQNNQNLELNSKITAAYSKNLDNKDLLTLKDLSRNARRYGFRLSYSKPKDDEVKQIHWAACMLVVTSGAWASDDLPKLLKPISGSQLDIDARTLIANSSLKI